MVSLFSVDFEFKNGQDVSSHIREFHDSKVTISIMYTNIALLLRCWKSAPKPWTQFFQVLLVMMSLSFAMMSFPFNEFLCFCHWSFRASNKIRESSFDVYLCLPVSFAQDEDAIGNRM